jgi:hypothetical protein
VKKRQRKKRDRLKLTIFGYRRSKRAMLNANVFCSEGRGLTEEILAKAAGLPWPPGGRSTTRP